ncbi:type I polyketide synthase [Lentzea aerocolonigenes]|uniref:type I polyketide synthase n=1 Tax=Lentzea aerocolonigenes TaxID=68170 RepID=UPI0004C41A86|nr:type I polyketide synthase [Lentzea aerocolonigenes]MCP2244012.1 Acyl transferase domain-containing protein [Lentzea aerocolonigenes]
MLVRPLPELLKDNALLHGDKVAYEDDFRAVTWRELEARTAALAAGLGVGRGDRVALVLGDGVALVEALLAVTRAAAVGVLISPHTTDAELTALLADCEPALVVTDRVPVLGHDRVVEFDSLATGTAGRPRDDLGLDEPAWLIYTSGTGGTPKAAVSTQRAALWSPVHCYGPVLGLSERDRLLWPLPMAHSFAHSLCLLGIVVAGASARVCTRRDPAAVAGLITSYEPTVLAGVPATYRQLLATGLTHAPSLRICLTAGAPSDAALRTEVEAALGAPLHDCYGSTETCGMIAVEPADAPRLAGTSGPPIPGVEVRLTGPDDEIWVRGPGLISGYHNAPELTAQAMPDGWYRTGDQGRLDAHGHLTVTGRVSDRIVRGGHKIDPSEVERVLLDLPGVRDVAVVARPHPLTGEAPVAFVVPADDSADPAALLGACAEVLSAHKVPEEVLFIPAIPRTGSGKPRRRVLRDSLVQAGTEVAVPVGGALELVLDELAAITGTRPDPRIAFADVGVTSLQATTLWQRLTARTGLRLAATLVWEHPTPEALAAHLTGLLGHPVVETTERVAPRNDPTEPIAIVGIGCRYPGGVGSPEDLWRLVRDGVDATGDFPSDRGWDLDSVYDPDSERAGTTYTRRGGFLDDVAGFDPAFFGISPKEALAMDPQQRLLLEVAWEALERSGVAPSSLHGTDTGVFVGLMHGGYGSEINQPDMESHLVLGSAGSVASGRISYVLGLRGPSMTIDTACSSSLVALHLAARALRAGECSLALAGGATVMATPRSFIAFSQQRALSPDGRCRSYSAGADGTGWAEGAGLVVLERLADARRNGHPVLAVLRGSAVNSDGASNGLTAPSTLAQQEVIRLALADAGLKESDVDVVEGHGTATRLGDPVEVTALLATYGRNRAEDRPLLLGSVKSNLGHTQAAAGVAGLIKLIWALRHDELPKSLYADVPTPHVDWSAGAVRLVAEHASWPKGERPRRGAVSSFGIGGTNAHVIIEEPPAPDPRPPLTLVTAPWVIGGADEAGLRAHAAEIASTLSDESVVDIGYSLATTRAPLRHRAAVLTGDRSDMLAGLRDLARGAGNPLVRKAIAQHDPRPVFLFTGQGAQRPGMGRELAEAFPAFGEAHRSVCEEFDLPLADLPADLLDRTDYTQPALFAFEVAMCALLDAHGVRPGHVVGHSIGELAAAHVAGVLSLPDAVRLVAARGRAMAAMQPGVMVSVQTTETLAAQHLDGPVAIAAVNGAGGVVLSGTAAAVDAAVARIGRPHKVLRGGYAFHSPLLDPVLDEFRAVAESVTYHRPEVPFVSTLTGRRESETLTEAAYWVRQAREAVRFADAVDWLTEAGATLYTEVGPSAALAVLVDGAVATGDEPAALLDALASLHVRGVPVDWPAVYADSGARRCDLPTHPFQRERYWLGQSPAAQDRTPLLGEPQPDADGPEVRHTSVLSTSAQPWLADHRVNDDVVVPATAFVDMVLQATGSTRLDELVVHQPLLLSGETRVQVVVDGREVAIWAAADGAWTRHASATTGSAVSAVEPPGTWPPPGAQRVPISYGKLAVRGHRYGPAFRAVTALWRRGDEVFADVDLPRGEAQAVAAHALHPCLLDAALHASLLAEAPDEQRIPFAFTGVELHRTGAVAARVRITRNGPDDVRVRLTDPAGRPVATIESLVTRRLDSRAHTDAIAARALHLLDWIPVPPGPAVPAGEVFDTRTVEATGTPPERTRQLVAAALDRLQQPHADPLVVITRNATGPDPDLAGAAVWGMVSSAQQEQPGSVVLVDLCGRPASDAALDTAITSGAAQVSVRGGQLLTPTLVRAPAPEGDPFALNRDGTVLITGGTGALGAILASHLVSEHGARHLTLASRRGERPDWADELAADVVVVACDVSDRAAVDHLVASCDPALTAVFHLAGVLDDGVLSAMDPKRFAEVLAPKADGAWHLHEATAGLELSAFVLYSSAAGVLGRPGQSNYAAANSFLDALARHRTARGLPARSLAWGLWESDGGMGGSTPRRNDGVLPLSAAAGMAAFDRAMGTAEPVLVPVLLDARRPAILRDLTHGAADAEPATWSHTLAEVPAEERLAVLTELLRAEVAAVLGFPDSASLPLDKDFTELGFDSLTVLQLRNRIGAVTGLRLSPTTVFDHPTLPRLATHVQSLLIGAAPADPAPNLRPAALYHRILLDQDPVKAMGLRILASYALPSFSAEERVRHVVAPTRLAAGDAEPVLCYLPSYLAAGDPVPDRLSKRFEGEYDLFLVGYPGFGADRSMPEDVETLVRTLADSVRMVAEDRPIVLIGHCAGGLVAHALAAHLGATGVVLLESDHGVVTRDDPRALALLAAETRRPSELYDEPAADVVALAGGGYFRIFDGWRPEPSPVPTLLVRGGPTPEMAEADPERDWKPRWPLPHSAVDVPGDHDTLLTDHADTTAEAIRRWVEQL